MSHLLRRARRLLTALAAVPLLGAATVTLAAPASAAPPPLDALAKALVVTLPVGASTSVQLDNTDATEEPGEPSVAACPGTRGTLWLKLQPTRTLSITMSTTGPVDTVLSLYAGPSTAATPTTLRAVTCNDDASATTKLSSLDARLYAGRTYYVQAGTFSFGPRGSFAVSIATNPVAGPTNDGVAGAIALAPTGQTVTADTSQATVGPGDPVPPVSGIQAPSLWYSWTAPVDERVQISTASPDPGMPNAYLYVFAATGPTLDGDAYAVDDDVDGASDRQARVVLTVRQGTTYRIMVAAHDPAGAVDLDVRPAAAGPADDDFAHAVVLSGQSDNLTGTTALAGVEPGEPRRPFKGASRAASHSVWYAWTAPFDGHVEFSTGPVAGVERDTTLAAWTGDTVDTLTAVAGNDDRPGSLSSTIDFVAHAGTTYRIVVDGDPDQMRGEGTFVLGWSLVRSSDLRVVSHTGSRSGATLSFVTTIRNDGPSPSPASRVRVSAPAGASVTAADESGDSCLLEAAAATCATGPLAVGESRTVTTSMSFDGSPGVYVSAVSLFVDQADPDPSSNTATAEVRVNAPVVTSTTLRASTAGDAVSLLATVESNRAYASLTGYGIEGTVVLADAGVEVARQPVDAGPVTLAGVAPGTHRYTATFVPAAPDDYAGSVSPEQIVTLVAPEVVLPGPTTTPPAATPTRTTTVIAAPRKARAGSRPTVTVTVTGTATGSVTVTVGGRPVGTVALAGGHATFRLPKLRKGRVEVGAVCAATATASTSAGTATIKVRAEHH